MFLFFCCDDCESISTLQVMFWCCFEFIGSCYALNNDFHFNLIANTGELVFVPMRNNRVFSALVLLCCSSCQPRPFVNISNVEVVEEFHVFTRTFQPCIKPRLQIWHRFLLSAAQVRYRGTSRGCESEGCREKAVTRVDQQGEAVTMEYLFLSPLYSTVSTQHCQFTTQ